MFYLASIEIIIRDDLGNIINDIKCDIYPAARIEEIGRKPEDRLQLIDKMLPKELESAKDEIKAIQITLEKNAQEIKTVKSRHNQKLEKIKDFESVVEEIKLHKKNKPKGLDDKIDKEFDNEGKKLKTRRQEKKFVEKLLEFYDETLSGIGEITQDISDYKKNNDPNMKSLYWALGSILFSITIVWTSVSFFGQLMPLFYCVLGMIGSCTLFTLDIKCAKKKMLKVSSK